MVRSSILKVQILRETAKRLQNGSAYQWGHMGSCNCGHLAQTITKLSKATIHTAAMQRYGDWSEQLRDYCPQSGFALDEMIDRILDAGFTREELINLERLKDCEILSSLPKFVLRHNVKEDVVLYLNTWADQLEEQLLADVNLKHLQFKTSPVLGA